MVRLVRLVKANNRGTCGAGGGEERPMFKYGKPYIVGFLPRKSHHIATIIAALRQVEYATLPFNIVAKVSPSPLQSLSRTTSN